MSMFDSIAKKLEDPYAKAWVAFFISMIVGGVLTYAALWYNDYYYEQQAQKLQEPPPGPRAGQRGPQRQGGNANETHDMLANYPKQALSQQEIDDILFMREEEKLARDVYLALYDKWGEQIFKNIAESEQRHMDAVKALIDRYELEDPVKADTRGVFTNPRLAELYTQLVEQGSKSLVDALKVGATIEDLDISDLNRAIDATDNQDIKAVYENLRSGSYNHLRAFVKKLKANNADYSPQYISEEEYQKILNDQTGRRHSGRGHSNNRGLGRRVNWR